MADMLTTRHTKHRQSACSLVCVCAGRAERQKKALYSSPLPPWGAVSRTSSLSPYSSHLHLLFFQYTNTRTANNIYSLNRMLRPRTLYTPYTPYNTLAQTHTCMLLLLLLLHTTQHNIYKCTRLTHSRNPVIAYKLL